MVTSICTNNDCQNELGKVGKVRSSICDWFNLVVKKEAGDRLVSHIKATNKSTSPTEWQLQVRKYDVSSERCGFGLMRR